MSSEPLGHATSDVEVTNVGKHGVWVLVRDREYFMPYDEFPWFLDAPLGHVLNVKIVANELPVPARGGLAAEKRTDDRRHEP